MFQVETFNEHEYHQDETYYFFSWFYREGVKIAENWLFLSQLIKKNSIVKTAQVWI